MDAMIQPKNDTALLQQGKAINILAVEDDAISMAFLEAQIADLGHQMQQAANGKEALQILREQHETIDLVLMDREMPVMDGMKAVRIMKEDKYLRTIPVIMVTGSDSSEDMREGLAAGVFYYITKPVDATILNSVIAAALREVEQQKILKEELGQHKNSFNMLKTARFEFQTLSEAESLAAFMANCFPNPERVLPGLGALLINAIEHGNLSTGYEKKSELLEAGIWRAEIERVQRMDIHKDKVATATIAHKNKGVYAIIEDMGEGFVWRKYMQIDPSRSSDNHGRGIAQANVMSFDKITYNERGNQAIAFVSHQEQLDW